MPRRAGFGPLRSCPAVARRCCAAVAACALALVLPGASAAASPDDSEIDEEVLSALPPIRERYATGWSFYVDNDFLSAGLSSDQGYTGGFGLSLSGRRAIEYPWSLDPALGWIDRTTGWHSLYADQPYAVHHSWQIGTMAFTPDDTDRAAPVPGERPYAGLIYIGNTRQFRLDLRPVSYLSNFTLGVVGSGVPPAIQNGLHDLVDDDRARGWDNQISDGGELTFLWQVQRRQTHWSRRAANGLDYEVNSVVSGGLGYDTHLSAGVTARWGQFSTPWWSFNPDFAGTINLGAPGRARGATELYAWAGLHVHHQIYDVFLEGQFRDSAVTYDRPDDLDSTLWEANVGATWGMASGYHLTLALRARQKQLRNGTAETPAWGSLILGRAF